MVGVLVSTGEPASKTRRNIDASEKTALAVAATAAVELTNLFFLLSGDDAEPRCSSCCWTEGLAMALAFAAFVSASGLVLAFHATGQRVAISGDRRRVLVLVSAAALFLASGAMALSLLKSSRRWILTG
nr:unnamed protein product [Digitaria exilis]